MSSLDGKRNIARNPGAARRRVLSVAIELLRGKMTVKELSAKLGLNIRTVRRVVDDAVQVGFKSHESSSGKVLLTVGRRSR